MTGRCAQWRVQRVWQRQLDLPQRLTNYEVAVLLNFMGIGVIE